MLFLKALRGVTLLVRVACYLSIGCLVAFFPLIHAAEAAIYPFWKIGFLRDHISIQDSLPYFFLPAMVCAFAQMLDSFLSRRISGTQEPAAEGN